MRWLAAYFMLSCATGFAQTPPARDRVSALPQTGTASISGRIVAAATGDPLRHSVVRIAGASVRNPPTLSDDEGRFQFTALPSGTFSITATKPGYARATARVDVEAGTTASAPPIALPKGGVITGFMVDDSGEAVSAGVFASRIMTKEDGSVQRLVFATAMADDTGAFRFGSLPAGTYSVSSQRTASGVIMGAPPGTDLNRIAMRMPDGPRIVVQQGGEYSGVVVVVPPDRMPLPPPPPGVRGGPPALPGTEPVVQPADPKQTIKVRGRVTIPSGPAKRTLLQLLPLQPAPPLVTQTDENGRFELLQPQGVEADFRIAARKPGFDFTEYGAQGSRRGTVLHLKPGDTIEDIEIPLKKLSSVNGRILDDFGDPVEGALVRVAQLRYADGQRKLVDAGSAVRTDDLGRYRLFGVRSGLYALTASVGQVVVTEAAADFPGYTTTYFPGTVNAAEIQLLSVGASQELNDLDFRLVRQKTFTIAGHASDSVGDPVSGGIALSPRRRSGSIAAIQLGAKIDPDGSFEFANVPPGEYVLQISRGTNRNAFSEGEFTYRFIDLIDADVRDLELQTGLGSTIFGHVVFEGGEPPSLDRMDLSAMPADLDRTPNGQSARARYDDANGFELARINGPRRLQVTRVPPGWMMKSVIVNGVDVTDEPLPFGDDDQSLEGVEVVLTNRVTRLAGRIAEARDVVPTDLAVLAFSSRRDQWYLNTRYIRRTVPQSDGRFTFEGLPPGEYFLLATYPPDDPGEWRDPDVLEKLALQATRARLSEGQQVSVEVRVR